MKFVATVFVVLVVTTGARALHPPVEPGSQNQTGSSGSTSTTTVSITSVTPVATPEPSAVTLAILGLAATFQLRRRSR